MITPADNQSLCAVAEEEIRRGGSTIERIPGLIARIIETEAWKEREVKHIGLVEFKSFRQLIEEKPLKGWGTTIDRVKALIEHDPDLLVKFREATTEKPGNPTGANQYNEGNNNNVIISNNKQGNSKAYTLTRLQKQAPDIYAEVKAGSISANAGAIKAGFRKKPTALEAALNAYAKLTDDEKQEFLTIII